MIPYQKIIFKPTNYRRPGFYQKIPPSSLGLCKLDSIILPPHIHTNFIRQRWYHLPGVGNHLHLFLLLRPHIFGSLIGDVSLFQIIPDFAYAHDSLQINLHKDKGVEYNDD